MRKLLVVLATVLLAVLALPISAFATPPQTGRLRPA